MKTIRGYVTRNGVGEYNASLASGDRLGSSFPTAGAAQKAIGGILGATIQWSRQDMAGDIENWVGTQEEWDPAVLGSRLDFWLDGATGQQDFPADEDPPSLRTLKDWLARSASQPLGTQKAYQGDSSFAPTTLPGAVKQMGAAFFPEVLGQDGKWLSTTQTAVDPATGFVASVTSAYDIPSTQQDGVIIYGVGFELSVRWVQVIDPIPWPPKPRPPRPRPLPLPMFRWPLPRPTMWPAYMLTVNGTNMRGPYASDGYPTLNTIRQFSDHYDWYVNGELFVSNPLAPPATFTLDISTASPRNFTGLICDLVVSKQLNDAQLAQLMAYQRNRWSLG